MGSQIQALLANSGAGQGMFGTGCNDPRLTAGDRAALGCPPETGAPASAATPAPPQGATGQTDPTVTEMALIKAKQGLQNAFTPPEAAAYNAYQQVTPQVEALRAAAPSAVQVLLSRLFGR